jgi:sugar-phosphatase
VRAVLFDVDGVLLDSYSGYREVRSRWCALRDVDLELAWAATHGRRPVETVAEVAPHLIPHDEYLVLQQLLTEVGDCFPAFEAAAPLLRALPKDVSGVVTSGQRAPVLARFAAAGIPEPGVLVDGDDVADGKPSPEGYLLAARRLGARPADCLVLEDAPAGVRAGKSAGMTVLAISSTHLPGELTEADHVAASLAEAGLAVARWLAGGTVGGTPPPGAVVRSADGHLETHQAGS